MRSLTRRPLLTLLSALPLTACAPAEPGADDVLAALAAVPHLGGADLHVTRAVDPSTHRVAQHVGGVPVRGSTLIARVEDGRVVHLAGRGPVDLSGIDPAAAMSADAAIGLAGPGVGPHATLLVDALHGKPRLVWEVRSAPFADDDGAMTAPLTRLDALTGELLDRREDLHTLTPPPAGAHWMSARGEHVGRVQLPVWTDGARGVLFEDPTRRVMTYDDDTGDITRRRSARDADPQAVDVHFGGAATLEYLARAHGMDGLDGAGGPALVASSTGGEAGLYMEAHTGWMYENAYWSDGAHFGDGFPGASAAWTPIDIVAHELGHGVIEYSADLIYEDESGAINESYADVFGAMVQRAVEGPSPRVWMIGEDTVTPDVAGDALRHMDDPTRDGDSADHYDDRYRGTWDSGGVHWNSGIGNLAFHLAANGGRHPRRGGPTVPAIGADAAMAIWLHALRFELTEGATFLDARRATERAATKRHGAGSPEVAAVSAAWRAVGVQHDDDLCAVGRVRGSLMEGEVTYWPDADGVTAGEGIHEAVLLGAPGTDLDLVLEQEIEGAWLPVAASTTPWADEHVHAHGAAGRWRWAVVSVMGGGDYRLCGQRP